MDRPASANSSAIISASWRTGGPRVVLHPFPKERRPVVVKVALDGGNEVAGEADRLACLGPNARRAGAAVPELLVSSRLHEWDILVETRVEGQILAPLLIRGRRRLPDALEDVSSWLERWGRATSKPTRLSRAQLEREVLGPAQAIAPELEGGAEYVDHLGARCSAVEGVAVPLTASHNDLTMWNVLVNGEGGLGVVDWEVADERTLPMKDFPYAVVDAVAATGRYEDRPGAVRACFEQGGSHATAVARLAQRVAGRLDLSAEVIELSFHACWLGHALNERRSARPGEPAPFRQIVQRLAERA